jgi:hypothetical protein
MCKVTELTPVLCASLLSFSGLIDRVAAAELPPHVLVERFAPEGQDFLPDEVTDLRFGEAVTIREGVAFVGMPNARDGGRVAVFNPTAAGWQRVDTLNAPESSGETRFGRSLTVRDGVLVVGGANAAYVFRRRNGVWAWRQTLLPRPFASIDFPRALRYQDGTLIMSVRSGLTPPFGAPAYVIIYEMNSSGNFVPSLGIVGFPVGPTEDFGVDISMTERSFVVGSPAGTRGQVAGVPAFDETGAVYRFGRHPRLRWRQLQRLVPGEPAPGFGTSVAINRDMIVVGAPKVDIEGGPAGWPTADGHTAGGKAYVFVPTGGPLGPYVESLRLRPQPDELLHYQDFGYRISMFGAWVAIAAVEPLQDGSAFPLGLVVTYTRDGTSVLPRGVARGHVAAASMSLANNRLMVGTPYERSCSADCVGSALIYDVSRFAR